VSSLPPVYLVRSLIAIVLIRKVGQKPPVLSPIQKYTPFRPKISPEEMHMDSLRCHHVQFEQKTKYSLGLERFLHENNDDGSNAQSIPYI
jgi:hypothetical protein